MVAVSELRRAAKSNRGLTDLGLVADLAAHALDHPFAVQPDERGDHTGIEVLAGIGLDRGEAALGGPGLFVRTLRGECVVHFGDGDDARRERNVLAPLPVRVPGPVPALVVLARDRASGGEELR